MVDGHNIVTVFPVPPDHFHEYDDFLLDFGGILYGGYGDDYYSVGNRGDYLVFDTSGDDTLVLPSTADDTWGYTFNNGEVLVMSSMDGDYSVVLPGWMDSENRIETFVFDDMTLTYNQIFQTVMDYAENYSDSYPESAHGMPEGSLDPHIELFEYMGDLDSTNFESIMNIDITGSVSSDALIDYLAI